MKNIFESVEMQVSSDEEAFSAYLDERMAQRRQLTLEFTDDAPVEGTYYLTLLNSDEDGTAGSAVSLRADEDPLISILTLAEQRADAGVKTSAAEFWSGLDAQFSGLVAGLNAPSRETYRQEVFRRLEQIFTSKNAPACVKNVANGQRYEAQVEEGQAQVRECEPESYKNETLIRKISKRRWALASLMTAIAVATGALTPSGRGEQQNITPTTTIQHIEGTTSGGASNAEQPVTTKPGSTKSAVPATSTSTTMQHNENADMSGMKMNGLTVLSAAELDLLRNKKPSLSRYKDLPAEQVWSSHVQDLTSPNERDNNGSNAAAHEAQFRASCEYSHLLFDDPIVYPGQPGKSHLHMFFGNTGVNAFTTPESLVNSGGGSCQGNELNRTGYWMPALLDGNNNVRVPFSISMYYKTRAADQVVEYPQGLAMIAGKDNSKRVGWACYDGNGAFSPESTIPPECPGGVLSAGIYFPQCWDGRLDSEDHKSHMAYIDDNDVCPPDHPKRLVQYSMHVYWKVGGLALGDWHLSSDDPAKGEKSGVTLHADWYGGWNQQVQDVWFNNCIKKVLNCSIGELGAWPSQLARRAPGEDYPHGVGDGEYQGQQVLALPKQ